MVYFQTKNSNLGKFWRALELEKFLYSMAIWKISRPFGILYGHLVFFGNLEYFQPFWYIVSTKIWQTLLAKDKRTRRNIHKGVLTQLQIATFFSFLTAMQF
jgi:hypothetical protein